MKAAVHEFTRTVEERRDFAPGQRLYVEDAIDGPDWYELSDHTTTVIEGGDEDGDGDYVERHLNAYKLTKDGTKRRMGYKHAIPDPKTGRLSTRPFEQVLADLSVVPMDEAVTR